MADVALVAGETLATPLDYLIPGAQEIVPKAVTAEYDGSGAGGDFVPTLIIRAPNGSVLAHAPIGSALTAGASADVSWFPRGRLDSSGIREITSTDGSVTVTDPFGPVTNLAVPASGAAYEDLTATAFALTAGNFGQPSWAHSAGSSLVDLTTPTAPVPKVAGIYIAEFYAAITLPPAPPGFLAALLLGQATVQAGSVATWAQAGGSPCANSVTAVNHFALTDTFGCVIFNLNSAAGETFTNLQLRIVKVA
jgi:hypothetical protein